MTGGVTSTDGSRMVAKLPQRNIKTYFVNVIPQGNNSNFKRLAYTLIGGNTTLVRYLGDHTSASDFPHGNAVHKDVVHIRSCPSVFRNLPTNDAPSNMYKKEIAKGNCKPHHQPVLQPRNTKQLSNAQARERQNLRLTHDALYNLHELAHDLDGFVTKITTYPDLTVICGSNLIVAEFNRVLRATTQSPQLLSYDTTFQLGDFYMSSLLFRHVAFTPSPVIPVLFLIHERKFQKVHEEFMHHVNNMLPAIAKREQSIPIVTDDEVGICKAIDLCLPNVTRLRCWNHTINAAKAWLRKHGASAIEIPVYISHLRDLLHQPSEEAYLERLNTLETTWSRPFAEYYKTQVHPVVSNGHHELDYIS